MSLPLSSSLKVLAFMGILGRSTILVINREVIMELRRILKNLMMNLIGFKIGFIGIEKAMQKPRFWSEAPMKSYAMSTSTKISYL